MIYLTKGYPKPIIPLLLPWNDIQRKLLPRKKWLFSQPFTISYIVLLWVFFAILGFGSTSNCNVDWQRRIICDSAIYANEIYTSPWQFIRSWFTAPWFVNGWDHLVYCTGGFLIFVQSYEKLAGTLKTLIVFFSGIAVVASICSIIIVIGYHIDPSVDFFYYGMRRNWMGSSVGFFAIIGALLHEGRKPWLLLIPVIIFEIWNGQTNISLHTSSSHMLAIIYGFVIGMLFNKKSYIPQ